MAFYSSFVTGSSLSIYPRNVPLIRKHKLYLTNLNFANLKLELETWLCCKDIFTVLVLGTTYTVLCYYSVQHLFYERYIHNVYYICRINGLELIIIIYLCFCKCLCLCFLCFFFFKSSISSTSSTPSSLNLSPMTTLVTPGSGTTPRGFGVEWLEYQRDTWLVTRRKNCLKEVCFRARLSCGVLDI